MNLSNKNLLFAFATCAFFFVAVPLFFPWLKLYFWAPFLVILIYKKPFFTCLWGAFSCGLLIDFFSAHAPLGLNALTFVVATGILYERRQNFFGDSLSTLPLMVLFFSMLSTTIEALLLYVLQKGFLISWRWLLTDLLAMPVLDALYAFGIFILPFALLGQRPRQGREYFNS